MSARIPGTAKMIDVAVGILPSGKWKGKLVRMELWDGYASKGGKSGYERIHHQWINYTIQDGISGCRSYSGRNLELAAQQLVELRKAMGHKN